ncbi:MAG: malonyl-CoA decarboxylase [Gammaproteobacteria bacterium]|nr:malonyl-CoA decarboxylase [Gammaproteobacteria bacterium]
MSTPSTSIFQRTLVNLKSAWRAISQSARAGETPSLQPDLPDDDADVLRAQMRACLLARGGEVSARARAAALGQSYLGLNEHGRKRFLQILAQDFVVDRQELYQATRDIHEIDNPERAFAAQAHLRRVLTPPSRRLLTQFNSLPAGVKFLVDMRADLMRYSGSDLWLHNLDNDLKDLLASWFDIGFLDLKRITWDAPAALLEKLIAHEAVHEIKSWDDLKHRLGPNRRCYAFFHPRMPDEPLIFVQVALVSGMSNSIQALLDETRPPRDPLTSNTAIFYSISNTQTGLHGVNFGDFLIKRVVNRLAREVANIKTFATLSPIPGFRHYLKEKLTQQDDQLLTRSERDALQPLLPVTDSGHPIYDLLATPSWYQDRRVAQALKAPLMRLCAHYLAHEKTAGHARDRVAHFHLSNGARIERINWLGDISPKGIHQSSGLMVNYRYKRKDIETNHETYRESGEASISASVRKLLQPTN